MDSPLDDLTPEQLQQLLHLGTLNSQDSIIQDQLQQAIAMGRPSGVEHSTALGGALGAVGDVGRGVGSAIQQHQLRGQQQHNLTEEEQARNLFAQLLRGKQPTLEDGVMPSADGGSYG